MATCMYCGGQTPEGAKYCTNCGAALPVEAPIQQQYQPPSNQQPSQQGYRPPSSSSTSVVNADDSGSIGWGILSFVFPIVGIILFFVWRNTKPNCAKVSLYGAVISIAVAIILRFSGCLTFWW